jgi:anti-anti-sigma factor
MEITETNLGEVLVIGVAGKLDAATSGQLEKFVADRLQAGATRLLFDLSALQYISSAGLRVLTMALKRLAAGAGRMALCGVQTPVRTVFDISGFSAYFAMAGTRDEGVELVSENAAGPARP